LCDGIAQQGFRTRMLPDAIARRAALFARAASSFMRG
jgi:hypothetical protein